MAQQTINIGTAPNDGTGDLHRTAFSKCNANFTELYSPSQILFSGDNFRIVIRGGALCIDQTITGTGFAGVEDTDWECLTSFKRP